MQVHKVLPWFACGAMACSFGVNLKTYFSEVSVLDAGLETGAERRPDAALTPLDAGDATTLTDAQFGCSNSCGQDQICANSTCKLPASCAELYATRAPMADGDYLIDVDGPGPIAASSAYCDMQTNGGWTLVFVGRGKEWSPRYLESIFAKTITRAQIAAGTRSKVEYRVLQDWPAYRSLYYERWLPPSLKGRPYAAPGWEKRAYQTIAPTPTTMNFWSETRSNTEGWLFDQKCVTDYSQGASIACDESPNGKRARHIDLCLGCLAGYLWFQQPEASLVRVGGVWTDLVGALFNGFFPDFTYGYWSIRNAGDFNTRWPEYDALADGQAMPGYGLYLH
jgi:hypothetical protein